MENMFGSFNLSSYLCSRKSINKQIKQSIKSYEVIT